MNQWTDTTQGARCDLKDEDIFNLRKSTMELNTMTIDKDAQITSLLNQNVCVCVCVLPFDI